MIWQNRFCPNLALPYWIYHSDCTGIGLAGLLSKQLANQMWGAYNLDTSSWNVYWGRILVVNSLQIRQRKVKLQGSSGNTLYVLKGCQLSSAQMGGWWPWKGHRTEPSQQQKLSLIYSWKSLRLVQLCQGGFFFQPPRDPCCSIGLEPWHLLLLLTTNKSNVY